MPSVCFFIVGEQYIYLRKDMHKGHNSFNKNKGKIHLCFPVAKTRNLIEYHQAGHIYA